MLRPLPYTTDESGGPEGIAVPLKLTLHGVVELDRIRAKTSFPVPVLLRPVDVPNDTLTCFFKSTLVLLIVAYLISARSFCPLNRRILGSIERSHQIKVYHSYSKAQRAEQAIE